MGKSTMEIGKRLVELWRANKNLDAVNELYDPKIVTIEAMSHDGKSPISEGIETARKKNQWWLENHEVKNQQILGPFPNGDRFIVYYKGQVVAKTGDFAGKEMNLEEGCLYTVQDGKIVKEEFFYHMG